jgi:hypothetical protein
MENFIRSSMWSELDRKTTDNYLRWNSLRSERYKLFYVATPKVACTTLKWWFAALEGYAEQLKSLTDNSESDPNLVVHESHRVAPSVTGLSLTDLTEALESEDFFRFAIVRNPYKRLFSAWQSKLLLREPLQSTHYVDLSFYHYPIKTAADIPIAFQLFLEHLAGNEAPSYWDHHWRPQTDVLRPDLIDYTQIFKIENPQKINTELTTWLGPYVPVPLQGQGSNISLIPYRSQFLTTRSEELIRELYAKDFDVFCYDRLPPAASGSLASSELAIVLQAVQLIRGRHQRLSERASIISGLNHSLEERSLELTVVTQHLTEASQKLIERDGQLTEASQKLIEKDSQLTVASQKLIEKDSQLTEASQKLIEKDSQLTVASQKLIEKDSQLTVASQKLIEKDSQLTVASQKLIEKDSRLKDLRLRIRGLLHSRSWNMTNPLRLLFKSLNSIRPRQINSSLKQSTKQVQPPGEQFITADRVDNEVEAITESGLFDASYYLAMYSDIQLPNSDPIRHYCEHGWREGRNPSDDFDTLGYLQLYSDIRNAGINPFWHYVTAGASESRQATFNLDPGYEADIYFGRIISDIRIIAYYEKPDWSALQGALTVKQSSYQLPSPHKDIGFYDTSEAAILDQQAKLATRHGISTWCFKLDLENCAQINNPLETFLANSEVDIVFVLELHLLSPLEEIANDACSILLSALADQRYLHIDGHPVLLTNLLEDDCCNQALHVSLKALFSANGINSPYLILRCDHTPSISLSALSTSCAQALLLDYSAIAVKSRDGVERPSQKNAINCIPYSVVVAQAIASIGEMTPNSVPYYTTITSGFDDSSVNSDDPLRYTRPAIKHYRRSPFFVSELLE